jgi:SAM-dependent methyltransferase
LQPASATFGVDRGQPVDRWYIDRFLEANARDLRGVVLEIAERTYTDRFGGDGIERAEVLHVDAGAPGATLIGDLGTGEGIPDAAFDCAILTQTLPFIYDFGAAIRHLERALRPGGVVLATMAGISQVSRYDMDRWGDYWRFTSASATRMFEEVFGEGTVSVAGYGNVLSAAALLYGVSAEELTREELDARQPDYEVLLGVRAEKRR